MAQLSAVHRRREARRLNSGINAGRLRRREKRNEDWAQRMIRRCWVPPDELKPLHADYRYWLCRRAGWDVLRPGFCTMIDGGPSIIPELSVTWRWWRRLPLETMIALSREASVRVGRTI